MCSGISLTIASFESLFKHFQALSCHLYCLWWNVYINFCLFFLNWDFSSSHWLVFQTRSRYVTEVCLSFSSARIKLSTIHPALLLSLGVLYCTGLKSFTRHVTCKYFSHVRIVILIFYCAKVFNFFFLAKVGTLLFRQMLYRLSYASSPSIFLRPVIQFFLLWNVFLVWS
jgi:hypothetical protein